MRKVVASKALRVTGEIEDLGDWGYDSPSLDVYLTYTSGNDAQAYIVRLSNPSGWGVVFCKTDPETFKEYPTKEAATVAALLSL